MGDRLGTRGAVGTNLFFLPIFCRFFSSFIAMTLRYCD